MSLLEQMSRWRGEPNGACRPFDRQRSGWVPGEGSGILILEEREHALGRGARIYGEVLGFGSGCDATKGGGLDENGVGTEVAVNAALRDAQLAPDEVGHVNAHGAATIVSDLAEARALNRVFGPKRSVPVTALKGFFGNIVSGSGAVELVGNAKLIGRAPSSGSTAGSGSRMTLDTARRIADRPVRPRSSSGRAPPRPSAEPSSSVKRPT